MHKYFKLYFFNNQLLLLKNMLKGLKLILINVGNNLKNDIMNQEVGDFNICMMVFF